MKHTLYTFLLAVIIPLAGKSQFACSGLDRVDVYVNNKLVATATLATVPTIKLGAGVKPDTVVFHAFTNTDGLRNSTVDVKDEDDELVDHVNSTGNTGYEALYTYIFNRDDLDEPSSGALQVFLNMLCEREIETSQIVTVSLLSR